MSALPLAEGTAQSAQCEQKDADVVQVHRVGHQVRRQDEIEDGPQKTQRGPVGSPARRRSRRVRTSRTRTATARARTTAAAHTAATITAVVVSTRPSLW